MSIEKLVAILNMNYKFGNINKPIVLRGHGQGAESIYSLKEQWAGKYDLYILSDFDEACKTAVEVAEREELKAAAQTE